MRKLFFCHIPKTGGTAFRKALEAAFQPWTIVPDANMIARNGGHYPDIDVVAYTIRNSKPDRISLLRGHYPLSAAKLLGDDAKTIVIIRDPVSRTISHLRHTMLHFGMTGETLRSYLDKARMPLPDNVQCRFLARDMKASTLDVEAFKQEVMDAAETIDYLATTGNIDGLCSRLSVGELGGKSLLLKEENKTPHVDFEFTDSDREMIASKNTLDQWLFDYANSREAGGPLSTTEYNAMRAA
jgi:hypothetical protein